MARPQATSTELVNDARVRVTRFDFVPGAETGWHTHEHDYVITAITDLFMLLELPGDETNRTMVARGSAYRRDKGVEHNVINDGAAPMSFVEVELK